MASYVAKSFVATMYKLFNLRSRNPGLVFEDYIGFGQFPCLHIRQPYYSHICYSGVTQQQALQLGRGNLDTCRLYDNNTYRLNICCALGWW